MSALEDPTSFKILRLKQSAQEQIADYVRKEICTGNLKPGVKLPSNLELAAQWDTNETTVQRAMRVLVREGLLVRVPCVGTFIREREEKLTCVGVYGDCGGTSASNSPYTHALRRALGEELREAGIEMDLWMDPRSPSEQGEPWQPLLQAAGQRQFQAFIGTDLSFPLLEWQRKLPVPTAFIGAPMSVPHSVNHDLRQFVEISLRELARQGCRSVGLIAPTLDEVDAKNHPEGYYLTVIGMLGHFMEVAGELGLKVKNDWMRVIHAYEPTGSSAHERFGYQEFLKLWSQPEKPEGLLVLDDVAARGAILAIQQKNVRVPEELKLALQKSESIDLFCPMPATFVVASEREMARALIEQVQKQFRGESCERISLPFKIVAHDNP